MPSKKCFKCLLTLPLTDYYKHKKMADGHLNKCKTCTRKDVKEKYNENIKQPYYVEKERKRGRRKYHRLYPGTGKANPSAQANWVARYPEKAAAYRRKNPSKTKGFEQHHWSYNKDHWADIIELTKKEHNKAHRFIIYDQEQMMYRRYDTLELLNTKERHDQFIRWCIDSKED